ncbi:hypothetical protein WJX72_009978 [[Myrmecia] bisecta]|uniref:Uncharacterized protein n=1 Tax=[Myrmecia] bisecta TaxID=41462 RepID=A0AAW1R818_9CHLO
MPAPPPPVAVGERIQVRWSVLNPEDGSSRTRWWGAVLLASDDSQVTWTLRYDAFEDFEEEDAQVVFLPEGRIQTVGQEDLLRWRKEGQKGEEASSGADEDEIVALTELAEDQREFERELGCSLDQATFQTMQERLTPAERLHVAAGFRDFTDHIMTRLRERVEASGAQPFTVSAADVQDMLSSLARPQAGGTWGQ